MVLRVSRNPVATRPKIRKVLDDVGGLLHSVTRERSTVALESGATNDNKRNWFIRTHGNRVHFVGGV
jgi:hypothetical protein